jgi:hypothetical protein
MIGTASTSKSENEIDDDQRSLPSPSNLTILEDLQQTGLPVKSSKRKSRHVRPAVAKKTIQKEQPDDIEKGRDDCTAGFILDAIVDTTNHGRCTETKEEECEPPGPKEKILHRLEQARILKDLATTEVMIKKEIEEENQVLRKPWVFVGIVALTIGALGVVTAAIWMSIG